jgi:hypothetical protein
VHVPSLLAVTTPGTPKYWESSLVSVDVSLPPQLLEMYLAPSVVAAADRHQVSGRAFRALPGCTAARMAGVTPAGAVYGRACRTAGIDA